MTRRSRVVVLENPFHGRAANGTIVLVTHAAESLDEASGRWIRFAYAASRELAATAARECVEATPGTPPDPMPASVALLAAIVEATRADCDSPTCPVHHPRSDPSAHKPDPRAN